MALKAARVSACYREADRCRACGLAGVLHRHEEPPRSHGGWKQLVATADVVLIRRRIMMLCSHCHRNRHPGPFAVLFLTIRILDATLGTDGSVEFTLSDTRGEVLQTWETVPRRPPIDA